MAAAAAAGRGRRLLLPLLAAPALLLLPLLRASSFLLLGPSSRGAARPSPRLSLRAAPAAVTEEAPVEEAEAEVAPPTAVDRDELPPLELRPGSTDQAAFAEGTSPAFWRAFNPYASETEALPTVSELTGPDARFWLYHLGRFGFFANQALMGVAASSLAQSFSGSTERTSGDSPNFYGSIFDDPSRELRGRLQEASAAIRQDLSFVKEGYYKAPYDMSPRHRQWSPAYVADRGFRFIREAVGTMQRSRERADTKTWVEAGSDLYPKYYQHTFHYQTDGWLSSDSAEVYETSTETLFLGRQDGMQRTTLVHISRALERLRAAGGRGEPKLLEIGCGTGRVMSFVRDNWPSLDVTVSDLSPYYLEKARENNAYWERRFAQSSTSLGRSTFVQANAEALPFEEESFDVVVSVYLFHELPAEAQDAVFADVSRVLAPGGVFVLTDSVQLGDRPYADTNMGRFGDFAEPHYKDYIRRSLADLGRAHGLEPFEKEVSSSTKSLSFIKRAPSSSD